MVISGLLLGLIWSLPPQAHPAAAAAAPPAHHRAAAITPAPAAPKGPKTPTELQQDLAAALHAAPFGSDQVRWTVTGNDVTLAGQVHSAEDKGMATRAARRVATKDGWTSVHVFNHIEVELQPQN